MVASRKDQGTRMMKEGMAKQEPWNRGRWGWPMHAGWVEVSLPAPSWLSVVQLVIGWSVMKATAPHSQTSRLRHPALTG